MTTLTRFIFNTLLQYILFVQYLLFLHTKTLLKELYVCNCTYHLWYQLTTPKYLSNSSQNIQNVNLPMNTLSVGGDGSLTPVLQTHRIRKR